METHYKIGKIMFEQLIAGKEVIIEQTDGSKLCFTLDKDIVDHFKAVAEDLLAIDQGMSRP